MTCANVPLMNRYYPKFVDALINASTATDPVIKVNGLKHWWSDELTELKLKSIDSSRIWKDAVKPRSGKVFDMYLQNNNNNNNELL